MTGSQTDKVHVPLRDISIAALCEVSRCIFNSGAWMGNEEAFQRWMSIRELIDLIDGNENIPPLKLKVFLQAVEYGHILWHRAQGTLPSNAAGRFGCCNLDEAIYGTIRLLNQADKVRA